jgi:predicted short-subunit dehydrogenase-like oxidoreductase (DUF2520 family)
VQIFGRNASAASALAYELDTESTAYWSVVNRQADVYIVAVSDIAIEEVIRELQLPDKTVVHTAAAVSKHILQPATEHYGVLYPLQSLKKSAAPLPDIPLLIDASDEQTLEQIALLASSISENVVKGGDEERLKLHLAAVFCNNFVNHIYVLMQQYCRAENLDFNLLLPLIRETAARIETIPPDAAQTGPAIRHDTTTIAKHLDLLQRHPQLKAFYNLFTQSIGQQADL